ncbi:MAG: HAD hydrolase family protein [Bacteroidota bacterium]
MNQLEKFKEINTFIFDVDGVLTDSSVLILEDGKLLRKMSVKDGYAIKKAINKGYHFCIITGGKSEGVKLRLQGLGVTDIYLGQHEKLDAFESFIYAYDIDPSKAIYMGDDIPDIAVMEKVGLPCCPSNAVAEVLAVSEYVSPFQGGEGCARDVIEKVLKLRGDWS